MAAPLALQVMAKVPHSASRLLSTILTTTVLLFITEIPWRTHGWEWQKFPHPLLILLIIRVLPRRDQLSEPSRGLEQG